jgi:3-phenylpropionate/trans-cinnamate dioxygenase ferredoxin reductase subunit
MPEVADGIDPDAPFVTSGRAVIVGASLAGLYAAQALRKNGFAGSLTLIGDETERPYDRPPLSKAVLIGTLPVDHTDLPQLGPVDAEWKLGVAATGLDLHNYEVVLADGSRVGFDRLLIATGTRARPWPNNDEAALDGVITVRTREDARRLREKLAAKPPGVLVIGGGFIGSEVASVCRGLDIPVTLVERSGVPLDNALGDVIGSVAAEIQREHGVDLRCGVTVLAMEGDSEGKLRRAQLSDGTSIEIGAAVPALGAVRNTEWLLGSGLAADGRGVACDASCRAFNQHGIVLDDVFVAGDVSRWPLPLYGDQLIAVEHWDNACRQAETAAFNMLARPLDRRPHNALPAFWSMQFGINIKSLGLTSGADQIVVTQGSLASRKFVAVYGRRGQTVAAVAFDGGRWLPSYQAMIEAATPFPPEWRGVDAPPDMTPMPAGFPPRSQPTHTPTAEKTGPPPVDPRLPPHQVSQLRGPAMPRATKGSPA